MTTTELQTDLNRVPANMVDVGQHIYFPNLQVAEVLHVHRYTDSDPGMGKWIAFTVRADASPFIFETRPENPILLATAEQAAEQADKIKRRRFVADLHAMADLIDEDRHLPVPSSHEIMVHTHEADAATVRQVAEIYGVPVDDHLDDRQEVVVRGHGDVTYRLINWPLLPVIGA